MLIIKRYANRKLYANNGYITLTTVKQAIKAGTTVKVIDNVTGHDVTQKVLNGVAAMLNLSQADIQFNLNRI